MLVRILSSVVFISRILFLTVHYRFSSKNGFVRDSIRYKLPSKSNKTFFYLGYHMCCLIYKSLSKEVLNFLGVQKYFKGYLLLFSMISNAPCHNNFKMFQVEIRILCIYTRPPKSAPPKTRSKWYVLPTEQTDVLLLI